MSSRRSSGRDAFGAFEGGRGESEFGGDEWASASGSGGGALASGGGGWAATICGVGVGVRATTIAPSQLAIKI
jgi:hypothetical protein